MPTLLKNSPLLSKTTHQPNYNRPVDFNIITKIKLEVNNPVAPTLWVIYLFSTPPYFIKKRDKLEAIWFFDSEAEQLLAIEKILVNHLHILIN